MGNDNSKTTIENQQLILQLQHQILNSNSNNNTNPTKSTLSSEEIQFTKAHKNTNTNNDYQYNNMPTTLFDILNNKKIMDDVEKNPLTKRKLLEKILNEHRHIMTSAQVNKITHMLEKLPRVQQQYNNNYNNNTTSDYIASSSQDIINVKQSNIIEPNAEREEAEYRMEEEKRHCYPIIYFVHKYY